VRCLFFKRVRLSAEVKQRFPVVFFGGKGQELRQVADFGGGFLPRLYNSF